MVEGSRIFKSEKLCNIVEVIDGDRGINYPHSDEFCNDGFCLFLNAKNVTKDGFDFSECQFISKRKDNLLRNGKLQFNDIVLTTRGTIGNVALYDSSVLYHHVRINSGMVILRCGKLILPNFLVYLLRDKECQLRIFNISTGSAQPQLPVSVIKTLVFDIPSIPEQRRIAQALSDTDDLISSMEKLIAKKQNLKKAMMQELLTGKRRLDGFTGEWEEVELGKICDIEMGQSPDSISYNNKYHGLPLIQGKADIDEKSRETIKSVYTTEPKKIALTGDLVFTVRAPVGYVARVTFDCCIGRGVCAIKNVSPFLYYKLISLEKSWSDKASGSVFDSINGDVLRNAKIMVPKSSVEQDAISKVIKGLETEITSNYLKLEKLKLIKQAMMQELLTGHIRLLEQRG